MEISDINNYDKQHINRLLLQEKQINSLFNQLIRLVAPEMRKWHDAGNRNSVWIRNSLIEKKINKSLNEFSKVLENISKRIRKRPGCLLLIRMI